MRRPISKCMVILTLSLLLGISKSEAYERNQGRIQWSVCGETYRITKVLKSLSVCMRICIARGYCKAVSYNRKYRWCLVHETVSSPQNCVGYVYIKRETFSQQYADACLVHQCDIDSTCGTKGCFTRECPPIPEVEGATASGNMRRNLSKVKYTCKADDSVFYVVCKKGSWSDLPTCPYYNGPTPEEVKVFSAVVDDTVYAVDAEPTSEEVKVFSAVVDDTVYAVDAEPTSEEEKVFSAVVDDTVYTVTESTGSQSNVTSTTESTGSQSNVTSTTESTGSQSNVTSTTESTGSQSNVTSTTESTGSQSNVTSTTESTGSQSNVTSTTESTGSHTNVTSTTESTGSQSNVTSTTESTGSQSNVTSTTESTGSQSNVTSTTESTGSQSNVTCTTESTGSHTNVTSTTGSTGSHTNVTSTTGSTGSHTNVTSTTGSTGSHTNVTSTTGSTGSQTNQTSSMVSTDSYSNLFQQLLAASDADALDKAAGWGTFTTDIPRPDNIDLVKKLGAGGFGTVWAATDRSSGQSVAVKQLDGAFQGGRTARRAYIEMYYMWKCGCHENILGLLGVYETANSSIWLVCEQMESDLRAVIYRNILDDQEKRFIAHQICSAAQFLHSGNIIHRDIKPENVLWNRSNKVKLCDFGLARSLTEEGKAVGLPTDHQQQLSTGMGTLWHSSPEILMASTRYTTAADVWSVGSSIVQLLTGNLLGQGKDRGVQLAQIFGRFPAPTAQDIDSLKSPHTTTALLIAKKAMTVDRNTYGLDTLMRAKGCPPDAIHLCHQMLAINPNMRCSMEEALCHRYLAAYWGPANEVVMSDELVPPLSDWDVHTIDEYRANAAEIITDLMQ